MSQEYEQLLGTHEFVSKHLCSTDQGGIADFVQLCYAQFLYVRTVSDEGSDCCLRDATALSQTELLERAAAEVLKPFTCQLPQFDEEELFHFLHYSCQ